MSLTASLGRIEGAEVELQALHTSAIRQVQRIKPSELHATHLPRSSAERLFAQEITSFVSAQRGSLKCILNYQTAATALDSPSGSDQAAWGRTLLAVEKAKQSSPATRHGGAWGSIAPTHSWPRHQLGVTGQRHAPAALFLGERTPRYPLCRRLGGPQCRSGHRG
jgi:hypothetical protein